MIKWVVSVVAFSMGAALVAGFIYTYNRYITLEDRLQKAEETINVLESSKKVLDEVLLNQQTLEAKIRSTRSASNKALESSRTLSGGDRLDYLLRVLDEDEAARRDSSTDGTDAAVSGARKR